MEPRTRQRIVAAAVVAIVAALAGWRALHADRGGTLSDRSPADRASAAPLHPPSSSSRFSDTRRRAAPSASNPRATAATLPAPGTPIAAVYDDLNRRAAAGDAAAASRLYRDLQRCWSARRAERLHRYVSDQIPDEHAEAGVVQDGQVKMLGELRALVDDSAGLCAGMSTAQIDSLVPAMLRAAQLGDVRATSCYAGGGMDMMTGLLDHPEWLADMRAVPQMLDAAMRQGDWVAVELMHHAYAGFFLETPASQTIHPDPAVDYRYLRLERLGATGAFVRKLDRLLADTAATVTPEQIADGDAWAADAYARYFGGSSSNEVSNGANICTATDD